MARIGLKGLTQAQVSTGGSGTAMVYTGGSTVADLMVSADVTLNRDDVKLHADNHAVERANGMNGGTISLELASLPDTLVTKLLGYAVSSSTVTYTGEEAPYVGFGYIVGEISGGAKTYRGFWFPKVQFGLENDSAKTKGESTEFSTHQLQGEILGVITTTGGKVEYYYSHSAATESAVRTWLNGQANIS
jgi:phi13 family phage major tail protein